MARKGNEKIGIVSPEIDPKSNPKSPEIIEPIVLP